MNDFVASNGVRVALDSTGRVTTEFYLANAVDTQALREFFRAEGDDRLGRWRWPENPDYVVYDLGKIGLDGVKVIHEVDGYQQSYATRSQAANRPGSIPAQAAVAYFDAHPEPKPWHDAKPGEAWVVDTHIRTWVGEQAMTVNDDLEFHNSSWSLPVTDPDVRSARRIWPEASS